MRGVVNLKSGNNNRLEILILLKNLRNIETFCKRFNLFVAKCITVNVTPDITTPFINMAYLQTLRKGSEILNILLKVMGR